MCCESRRSEQKSHKSLKGSVFLTDSVPGIRGSARRAWFRRIWYTAVCTVQFERGSFGHLFFPKTALFSLALSILIWLMIALLTRAGYIGRVAVLAAGGLLTSVTSSPKTSICAQMTTSPDYGAWEALVKAHVKPSEIRGIGVNVVDYDCELFYTLSSCFIFRAAA